MGRVILLLMLACGIVGCDQRNLPPTGPTPIAVQLSVTAVAPKSGLKSSTVSISGSGFSPGATVTMGHAATNVRVVSSTLIEASTPDVPAGTVDVVVTDTAGRNATLAGGFTFEVVTLTASATVVMPGGALSVAWVAPNGRPGSDWVGLFRMEDPNTSYENGWWRYTNGDSSGALWLSAPTKPGQYEFRYLLDDSVLDVARSASVTVR